MHLIKQLLPPRLGLKKQTIRPLHLYVQDRHFGIGKQNYWVASLTLGFNLDDLQPILDINWWQRLTEVYGDKLPLLDTGLPKTQAEWLVYAHYYPAINDLKKDQVSFKFLEKEKKLSVFGQRKWQDSAFAKEIIETAPLTKTLLSYQNAFGGVNFRANPEGVGYKDGLLPLIEYPDQMIVSEYDVPVPASFAMVAEHWSPRKEWFGSFDVDNYLANFPNYPEDINPSYFNAAPHDQWLPHFIQGGESYSFTNMLPDRPYYQGHLPKYKARCFIESLDVSKGPWQAGKPTDLIFKEVDLHIDTAWFFPDANMGLLIWRGVEAIPMDEANHIGHLLVAYEHQDKPRSFDHYLAALERRQKSDDRMLFFLDTNDLIPDDHKSAIEILVDEAGLDISEEELAELEKPFISAKQELDIQMKELRDHMRSRGVNIENFDAENEKFKNNDPIVKRGQELQKKINELMNRVNPLIHFKEDGTMERSGKKMDVRELMRIDLKAFAEISEEMELMKKDVEERFVQQLVDQKESLMKFEKENQKILLPGTIQGIHSKYEEFDRHIDKMRKRLQDEIVREPLPRLDITETKKEFQKEFDQITTANYFPIIKEQTQHVDWEEVQERIHKMDEANQHFKEGYRKTAHTLPWGLSPHKKSLEEVKQDFLEKLKAGKLADGDFACIDLSNMDLSGVDLRGAYLEQVDLTNTDLTDADLTNAILVRANLTGVKFVDTKLAGANLGKAFCQHTSFKNIHFDNQLIIQGVHFDQCSILDCHFDQISFNESAFTEVSFAGSAFKSCLFMEQTLRNCNFVNIRGSALDFISSSLESCNFTEIDIQRLSVIDSNLERCTFDRAKLVQPTFIGDEASLSQLSFVEAEIQQGNFAKLVFHEVSFRQAKLFRCDFSYSDLINADFYRVVAEASRFYKAELSGADCSQADLREADFSKAILKGTDFYRSNLFGAKFIKCTVGKTNFDAANLDNTIFEKARAE